MTTRTKNAAAAPSQTDVCGLGTRPVSGRVVECVLGFDGYLAWSVALWPTGKTHRNAPSTGLWHQQSGEQSQRVAPIASTKRLANATSRYRPVSQASPRLMGSTLEPSQAVEGRG